MSPRPLPPRRGGPSPRRRWIVPCWVPAGTRIRLVPLSVGTSTVAPRIASTIVIGTSTSRLSPRRRKTGESLTRVIAYRSPEGPPRRPGPAVAGRARRGDRHRHRDLRSLHGLVEGDVHLGLQVAAALGPVRPAATRGSTGAEQVGQDVADPSEPAEAAAPRAGPEGARIEAA